MYLTYKEIEIAFLTDKQVLNNRVCRHNRNKYLKAYPV